MKLAQIVDADTTCLAAGPPAQIGDWIVVPDRMSDMVLHVTCKHLPHRVHSVPHLAGEEPADVWGQGEATPAEALAAHEERGA